MGTKDDLLPIPGLIVLVLLAVGLVFFGHTLLEDGDPQTVSAGKAAVTISMMIGVLILWDISSRVRLYWKSSQSENPGASAIAEVSMRELEKTKAAIEMFGSLDRPFSTPKEITAMISSREVNSRTFELHRIVVVGRLMHSDEAIEELFACTDLADDNVMVMILALRLETIHKSSESRAGFRHLIEQLMENIHLRPGMQQYVERLQLSPPE